jgi:hypothetical protein
LPACSGGLPGKRKHPGAIRICPFRVKAMLVGDTTPAALNWTVLRLSPCASYTYV